MMDDLQITDFIYLLIALGGIIYTIGQLTAKFATKEDVEKTREERTRVLSELEKKIESAMKENIAKSQEHHRLIEEQAKFFATKSALTEIKKEMFDDLKETKKEMKEGFERMDRQHRELMERLGKLSESLIVYKTRQHMGMKDLPEETEIGGK